MEDILYSVRMRASRGGNHISGGERLAEETRLRQMTLELLQRAKNHSQGFPDEIILTLEPLSAHEIKTLIALSITTIPVKDYNEGRQQALALLEKLGISREIATQAMDLLADGASPAGGNMRGAVIMDFRSGARLEPDQYRGVRASRMDITPQVEAVLLEQLKQAGINPDYARDALVLATKVANTEGTIAELCWSDDKDYVAGYVASKRFGYVRFPHLKPKDVPLGGRVCFVDAATLDLNQYLHVLETEPVLITQLDAPSKNAVSENPS